MNTVKQTGILVAILFLCTTFSVVAQENRQDTVERNVAFVQDTAECTEIFVTVEQPPEFTGGREARVQFLRDNLTYPKRARKEGLAGVVLVGFIVEKDGSLTNFSIIKSAHPVLDAEALRVVKLMPKWVSGKQQGKPVCVQHQMPITFTIN
jgi:protein TonB